MSDMKRQNLKPIASPDARNQARRIPVKGAALSSGSNAAAKPRSIKKDQKLQSENQNVHPGSQKLSRLDLMKARSKNTKGSQKKQHNLHKTEPWKTEQEYGARIYQITAYTTVEKIEKKFCSEQRQVILRKILATMIIIMILFILIARHLNFVDKLDRDKLGYDGRMPSFLPTETSTVE